jgi:nitrite reductase/ring-hydroxylating ferredoxin subunit
VSPARPAPGVRLIALAELEDPGARAVDYRVGEDLFSLIVARRGETVAAWLNLCPHALAPLDRFDGKVLIEEGRHLICSAHGASFDMTDGACTGGPAKRPLTPFAIAVRDGVVYAA